MAEYGYNSREAEKRRLRRNVISGEDPGKEANRLSPRVLLLVLLAVLLLAGSFAAYLFLHRATSYDVAWERAVGGSGDTFRYYQAFGTGFIRYTKDGAEYIDKNGSVIWERSYQLNSPVCAAGKEYAVIADCGGSTLYIFSREKETGSVTTLLPIMKAVPSDTGVIYAVLSDENAERISALVRDGRNGEAKQKLKILRCELMDELHACQRKVDRLDWLIRETDKQQSNE